MENKSLNVIYSLSLSVTSFLCLLNFYVWLVSSLQIFNSKLVLASPETATDADYAAILGVIGHEVRFLTSIIYK